MKAAADIQVDTWPWGTEKILWGFDVSHQYTYKALEPKRGKAGCLSLQYHQEKSETWVIFRGVAWALLALDGKVCTRVMRAGDAQRIDTQMIHRFTGVSEDLVVLEASTPDRHAADKNLPKDVVRLHCFMNRPCVSPRDAAEAALLKRCVEVSEEAMDFIARDKMPPEYHSDFLKAHGATSIL